MKLRAELENDTYLADVRSGGANSEGESAELVAYTISRENDESEGEPSHAGNVSLCEVMPGVFSLLEGHRSSVVRISKSATAGLSASIRGRELRVTLADLRDRAPRSKGAGLIGPQEVRAMMPGKVIRVLVSKSDEVTTGQGVMIVEAMKMQNELKAPKPGRVTRIFAEEGSTVAAGATLLVIE